MGTHTLLSQLHHIGRPIVELSSMACPLLLLRPLRRTFPEQLRAPGMIAHQDDRRTIPLAALLKLRSNMPQQFIRKRKIIEVARTLRCKPARCTVIDSTWMRDWQMD